jgi:hypothetical protein
MTGRFRSGWTIHIYASWPTAQRIEPRPLT